MNNYSDSLKDFSKLKANTLRINYAKFNLVKCIEQAIEIIEFQARERQLQVIQKFAPNLPL